MTACRCHGAVLCSADVIEANYDSLLYPSLFGSFGNGKRNRSPYRTQVVSSSARIPPGPLSTQTV